MLDKVLPQDCFAHAWFLLFQSVRRSLIVIRLKMRRMSSLLNVTEPIDKVWQNAQDLKFKSKTGSSLLFLADCSNNWVRRAFAKNWLRRNWCSDHVVNRHLKSFYGLPLYFKSESSVPVIGFNKVLSVTLHYVWKRPFWAKYLCIKLLKFILVWICAISHR